MFNLFKQSPEKEARQLHKDAASIVEMAQQTYRDTVMQQIVRITRDGIAQMSELAGDDRTRCASELERYRTLHREARRRHDQAALTAYTLVIIHTRSLLLGEVGAPARDVIDTWLADWPAGDEREGTLAG